MTTDPPARPPKETPPSTTTPDRPGNGARASDPAKPLPAKKAQRGTAKPLDKVVPAAAGGELVRVTKTGGRYVKKVPGPAGPSEPAEPRALVVQEPALPESPPEPSLDLELTGAQVALLEREMYSEAEAARLLQLPQSTLHYWLDGKKGRGDKQHRPVIRLEPRGAAASVTWAEFVEAGLLRQYRLQLRVPLVELRAFIDALRESTGIQYPLAHQRPWASGRALVKRAQDRADLPGDFWLVTAGATAGQLMLTPASEAFLHRARWHSDIVDGWRPAPDEDSPVIIDPLVRFGRPSVAGVSTEVLWEQADDGASDEEIAEAFDLQVADVVWALAYEKPRRLKAPA